MNKTVMSLLSVMLLASPLVQASSEAAWKQSGQDMQQACIKASQLSKVKVVGKAIEYDDSVGYSALLLEGRYPQKHMNNQRGRELCLFQRSSGKAVVSEADRLSATK
ncbi:hypothetical protein GKQ23_15090 [Erwinia sp. E602]|uniref:hypothetical protein n=1 Tax=Erwinia sp. E602 TaxID=2675378 RepID=UPI001BA8EFA1|nr:hypothetical protein [Erwinia sp. E602]QUG76243.1 hypothetical protein GKQ23_15090 [Erwinia sp. E602]